MAKYFGNQATLSQATSSAGRTENRPFPGTISEEDRFEIPKGSLSASDKAGDQEWCENENQPLAERPLREVRRAPSFSGPLMLPNRASSNSLSAPIKSSGGFRDSLEDKSKTNLVQIRGRFSVTSENVDLVKDIPLCTVPRRSSQGSLLRKSASVGDWIFDSKQMPVGQLPKEMCNSNVPASLLMPHLQNLFQQTSIQQDLIVNLLNSLQPVEVADASQNGKLPPLACSSENNGIWKLHLFELEEEMKIDPPIKYVLYEGDLVHETGSGEDKDETAKQWRVQAMGISPDKFECRKALPSQWRGLRDEELSKEAGIPGCVFVHMSGFIGGNQSFEGALAMARGALKL